jgi:uncharacterized metal-binding protein
MAEQRSNENDGETLIFTCAGAAYSGQVSNRAGVNLMQSGVGNLFCAAAVAAEIPEKLARARDAARRVVIDGCEDHCARKIIAGAGLPVDVHLDVATIGIPRRPAQPDMIGDARRAADAVVARIKGNG